MGHLAEKIVQICRHFQECRVDVELREKGQIARKELEMLCQQGRQVMDISKVDLLLALMDAYEVTRDEGMLQEVLDVVSENLGVLPVSVESVKLLAYCYYYVEEEECAVKAREMLVELKQRGEYGEEIKEAEEMLES